MSSSLYLYSSLVTGSSDEELELEEEKKRVKKVDDYFSPDIYSARFVWDRK